MPTNYISPISMDALSNLCGELDKNNFCLLYTSDAADE